MTSPDYVGRHRSNEHSSGEDQLAAADTIALPVVASDASVTLSRMPISQADEQAVLAQLDDIHSLSDLPGVASSVQVLALSSDEELIDAEVIVDAVSDDQGLPGADLAVIEYTVRDIITVDLGGNSA